MTDAALNALAGPDRYARLYSMGARLAQRCDQRTVRAALIEANPAKSPSPSHSRTLRELPTAHDGDVR